MRIIAKTGHIDRHDGDAAKTTARAWVDDRRVVCGAKVVAGTLIDLLADPRHLADARREHERRTAGEAWIAPLLPADFTAPIELPWPAPTQEETSP